MDLGGSRVGARCEMKGAGVGQVFLCLITWRAEFGLQKFTDGGGLFCMLDMNTVQNKLRVIFKGEFFTCSFLQTRRNKLSRLFLAAPLTNTSLVVLCIHSGMFIVCEFRGHVQNK